MLGVILCHTGVPGFAGGFVGVDVFFVISGYLITAHLASGSERKFASVLADFYARRARRILPPLAVVIFASLVAGRLLLLPNGEQQDLAKSAIAAAAFVSNFHFWQFTSDYFSPAADL